MITSKKTGIKYLEVAECEKISKKIEEIIKGYGLNIKVQFHPKYLEVPTKEGVSNE